MTFIAPHLSRFLTQSFTGYGLSTYREHAEAAFSSGKRTNGYLGTALQFSAAYFYFADSTLVPKKLNNRLFAVLIPIASAACLFSLLFDHLKLDQRKIEPYAKRVDFAFKGSFQALKVTFIVHVIFQTILKRNPLYLAFFLRDGLKLLTTKNYFSKSFTNQLKKFDAALSIISWWAFLPFWTGLPVAVFKGITSLYEGARGIFLVILEDFFPSLYKKTLTLEEKYELDLKDHYLEGLKRAKETLEFLAGPGGKTAEILKEKKDQISTWLDWETPARFAILKEASLPPHRYYGDSLNSDPHAVTDLQFKISVRREGLEALRGALQNLSDERKRSLEISFFFREDLKDEELLIIRDQMIGPLTTIFAPHEKNELGVKATLIPQHRHIARRMSTL